MYKVTTVEDQQKLAVPMNEITETINYNLRMIIDSDLYNKDSQPRAWLLSKTKRINPNGICVATFAQDLFDQHHDYIERDEDGFVIGAWANYWDSAVEPISQNTEQSSSTLVTSKITISGTSNQVKVGGSKTFTVYFFEDNQVVEHDPGTWSFYIGEENAEELLSISYPAPNKVRIKIKNDDDLIGKILSVKNTSDDVVSSFDVGIIAF